MLAHIDINIQLQVTVNRICFICKVCVLKHHKAKTYTMNSLEFIDENAIQSECKIYIIKYLKFG